MYQGLTVQRAHPLLIEESNAKNQALCVPHLLQPSD